MVAVAYYIVLLPTRIGIGYTIMFPACESEWDAEPKQK